ncbi:anti-sigma factor family protein [Haliangium sp.]|uniref:anti-sigma factor family protein n=1 Tax=Haliangium sp. TaxID=2663208 RepID=UPI003D09A285
MRCPDVHELASAYIDGELDDARSSALRGHLRECDECRCAVLELAAVRDAAMELESLDPPPGLWDAVSREVAAAEIADAHRSRLWLYWQRLRPRLLPGAVVLAAAATALIWLWRHPAPSMAPPAPAASERTATAAPTHPTPPLGQRDEGFDDRRGREFAAADRRYADTLTELRALVDEERATWSPGAAAQLERRLEAFAVEAQRQRRLLAEIEPADPSLAGLDPRGRDALYATYRAEIALLQHVAMYGEAALDDREARP